MSWQRCIGTPHWWLRIVDQCPCMSHILVLPFFLFYLHRTGTICSNRGRGVPEHKAITFTSLVTAAKVMICLSEVVCFLATLIYSSLCPSGLGVDLFTKVFTALYTCSAEKINWGPGSKGCNAKRILCLVFLPFAARDWSVIPVEVSSWRALMNSPCWASVLALASFISSWLFFSCCCLFLLLGFLLFVRSTTLHQKIVCSSPLHLTNLSGTELALLVPGLIGAAGRKSFANIDNSIRPAMLSGLEATLLHNKALTLMNAIRFVQNSSWHPLLRG